MRLHVCRISRVIFSCFLSEYPLKLCVCLVYFATTTMNLPFIRSFRSLLVLYHHDKNINLPQFPVARQNITSIIRTLARSLPRSMPLWCGDGRWRFPDASPYLSFCASFHCLIPIPDWTWWWHCLCALMFVMYAYRYNILLHSQPLHSSSSFQIGM